MAHPRSWGLLVASALSAGREITAARLPGATLIGTVPHQHSYGLESLIMLALQHELVLHTQRPFYPDDIRAQLEATPRPRILVTTPAHLRVVLEGEAQLPAADLLLSATAPLPLAMACAAEEAFAAPLHEIYGCSEAGQIASRRTMHGSEWRCLDGISLRQDGASTWACSTELACDTRLGDIIELSDSFHFRLLGRAAEQINIAGRRASLEALGAQLQSIPGVRDAVFAMAEATSAATPRLVAFAVAPGLREADLRAALRTRIDPAFLPRRIYLVERLDRTELGKLTRASLHRLLAGLSTS